GYETIEAEKRWISSDSFFAFLRAYSNFHRALGVKGVFPIRQKKPGEAGPFRLLLTLDQALIRTRWRVLSTERAPFAHST
ncbi:MAG: hypothetical protein ACREI1_12030, partial [Nitrospiraceae bacterium]